MARLNEAFHQEMLFRSASSEGAVVQTPVFSVCPFSSGVCVAVINENVTPPLIMQLVP